MNTIERREFFQRREQSKSRNFIVLRELNSFDEEPSRLRRSRQLRSNRYRAVARLLKRMGVGFTTTIEVKLSSPYRGTTTFLEFHLEPDV